MLTILLVGAGYYLARNHDAWVLSARIPTTLPDDVERPGVFAANGEFITIGGSGFLERWDPETGKWLGRIGTATGAWAAVNHNRELVVYSPRDRLLTFLDVSSSPPAYRWSERLNESMELMAVAPDGKSIVVRLPPPVGGLRLLHRKEPDNRTTLASAAELPEGDPIYSPDGHYIVIVTTRPYARRTYFANQPFLPQKGTDDLYAFDVRTGRMNWRTKTLPLHALDIGFVAGAGHELVVTPQESRQLVDGVVVKHLGTDRVDLYALDKLHIEGWTDIRGAFEFPDSLSILFPRYLFQGPAEGEYVDYQIPSTRVLSERVTAVDNYLKPVLETAGQDRKLHQIVSSSHSIDGRFLSLSRTSWTEASEEIRIWRRVGRESILGVLGMPQCWTVLAIACLWCVSLWRDARRRRIAAGLSVTLTAAGLIVVGLTGSLGMLIDWCIGRGHWNPAPLWLICGLGLTTKSRRWGWISLYAVTASLVVMFIRESPLRLMSGLSGRMDYRILDRTWDLPAAAFPVLVAGVSVWLVVSLAVLLRAQLGSTRE